VTGEVDLRGTKMRMTMTSTGIGGTLFAVGTSILPPSAAATPQAAQETVDGFRAALVQRFGAQVRATRPARMVLPPGASKVQQAGEQIEATASAASRSGASPRPIVLAARFFVVDDRFYQLVAAGAEDELPPEAVDNFFTSFRLKGAQ
jgi:hypothetical protein